MCLILLLMGLKADGRTLQHAMLKKFTTHISPNWKVKYAALYSTGLLGSWRFLFSFRNSAGHGRGEYISFSGDTCYWMIFHLMQKYLNRCFMQIYLNQGTSCRNIVQCQPCTASSASLAMPALHCKVQSVHA